MSQIESKVDVVIVCHNSAEIIQPLLRSLEPALHPGVDLNLVVVDNASTDDTIDRIVAIGKGVVVLPMPTNLGYAGAINCALRTVREDSDILVLNPDVVVSPQSVLPLTEALRSGTCGITAPVLRLPDGSLQFTMRRRPTIVRAFGDAVLGGSRAGRFERLGETVVDPVRYQTPCSSAWFMGAALMISRRCFEALGPLDDSFFLYSEDTEYCLRAWRRGLRCDLVPAALMMHSGGESQARPDLRALLATNRIRLYRSSHGLLATVLFAVAVFINESIRAGRGARECRTSALTVLRRGIRGVLFSNAHNHSDIVRT